MECKFCCGYVEDTLFLVKPADIPHMHNLFNKFDKNLRFTVEDFANDVPHFLEISPIGLINYGKSTHTSQYVNFENYTGNYKMGYIRSLVTSVKQICSADILSIEIHNVNKFASWNVFPKPIRNLIN